MTTEIKDQTKRIAAIALLEATCEKNYAAIRIQRLTLQQMEEKQVNRLAELRLQKMLLAAANKQMSRLTPAATTNQ